MLVVLVFLLCLSSCHPIGCNIPRPDRLTDRSDIDLLADRRRIYHQPTIAPST